MNRNIAIAFVLLTLACTRATPVPQNTQMWRLESAWQDAPVENNIRIARAAIIVFRSSSEYVEIHTNVIERVDGTVYIRSGGERTGAVGEWKQSGSKVKVDRKRVVGMPCGGMTYTVTADSVIDGSATYTPVTQLVAPEFETLVNGVKQAGTKCGDD